MGSQDTNNSIKTHSKLSYDHRVIVYVNKEEENAERRKRNTTTGRIKVSGLSNKMAKKSDTRLAWDMIHKIYHIYSYINNKEETNAALLLTVL